MYSKSLHQVDAPPKFCNSTGASGENIRGLVRVSKGKTLDGLFLYTLGLTTWRIKRQNQKEIEVPVLRMSLERFCSRNTYFSPLIRYA